ncbi:MAG: AsmA family protein [Gammaproteobacteria bacterium]|jgi:AsmA protein
MARLLKLIGALVAILAALVVVAIIVLPLVIDPNDYKDEIAAEVARHTGRTLTIEGDMALSVFPWLGLDIGPAELSNAAGFEVPYMARMKSVQVRVKLLPLLKKQLEVDTVRLNGLELNLARDKDGRTNWADLAGESAADKGKTAEVAGSEKTGDGLAGLAIGGIEVADARLTWDDRTTATRYEITDLAFTTGAIEPDRAFDLDLDFRVSAVQPAVEGRFHLKGSVLLAAGLRAVDVKAATIDIDATGAGVPGKQVSLSLASDVFVDLDAQTLSLPNLVLETLGLNISGTVAGTRIMADDPQFSGALAVAQFSPRAVIDKLGLAPVTTRDARVLEQATAALEWTASPQFFAASSLNLGLDDTRIDGNARIDSFAKPAIRFALKVDRIDLDRYLPPEAAEETPGQPAAAEAAGSGSTEPLPLDTLRSLNLDGRLEVGELKAFNLQSSNIVVQVKANNGLLRLNPLGASLYAGQYSGDITLDARKDTPRIAIDEKIAGVQAGPLLQDLVGEARVQGKADVTAKLSGSGTGADAIKETLNGTTSFSFTEGAVKGVNIAALIRKAQAKLKGQPAPQEQPNQTDFSVMQGTATVHNGVVRNDDLLLQSPLLRISGKGQVSLPAETIDYTLTTKLVGSLEGQGGKSQEELKGVSIPVRVGGTFSKPTYVPDLGAALSEAAKARVEEKVEEQKQKLQEKLGDELQDKLLKGLFN